MWMSNYTDESKFDEFAKTLTWEGHAEKIRNPYLVLAGEADELSPLRYTERMVHTMTAPRQLVVYADSRHSVGGVPRPILARSRRLWSPIGWSRASTASRLKVSAGSWSQLGE